MRQASRLVMERVICIENQGSDSRLRKHGDLDGFSVTGRTAMHTCFHTCCTVLPVPLAHPQLPVIRVQWLGGCGYVEGGRVEMQPTFIAQ